MKNRNGELPPHARRHGRAGAAEAPVRGLRAGISNKSPHAAPLEEQRRAGERHPLERAMAEVTKAPHLIAVTSAVNESAERLPTGRKDVNPASKLLFIFRRVVA
jgi:hypothetical protein